MPPSKDPSPDLAASSAPFLQRLLADYARDELLVPPVWRDYFRELLEQDGRSEESASGVARPSFDTASIFNPPSANGAERGVGELTEDNVQSLQARAAGLIHAFRQQGHLAAQLDPLERSRPEPRDLSPEAFGISEADLDRTVMVETAKAGRRRLTMRRLVDDLRATWCGHIGFEFMHVGDRAVRDWVIERVESDRARRAPSPDEQRRILRRLTEAAVFEEFVRKKYIGSKTFSLEGAETLIPLLDLAIEHAAAQGVEEIVFGMAHRGRLNVLANIIGQPAREIFKQFEDDEPERYLGGGDVKYHLGASGDRRTRAGRSVHLSLCFNPSHLEFVNPVALGRMRAKQDRTGDGERRRGMTLLIHGDAGFAGEGIVQESLNLSRLAGYTVGGTLHVIVNNQLGFTTSPEEGRSTAYPSDVARMLPIPIFHVNGEQPDAVARVVAWAMEFRQEFQRDVVIDVHSYRRWGHNETDEPSFTQPLMYEAIEERDSVQKRYARGLVQADVVSQDELDELTGEEQQRLKEEFRRRKEANDNRHALGGVWKDFAGGLEPEDDDPDTGADVELLRSLLVKLTETPRDFHLHPKLERSVKQRREMARGERPVDWSAAEALAMATLAIEGHRVRLSGQDSARGTFSQRHAVLHDVEDGYTTSIFGNLAPDQAPVEIINSPLSEAGVMGFDYGFSLDYPEALVAWEAQYGDFSNAAQVILDQFLASAEDKWRRLSGMVLLLPHGFEGQGPEHSSARAERFLGQAAEDNLQVVVPTTPAQYFHVLRRQVKRRWRKPLVVLTPKSLLRHAEVVSPLEDLSSGRFQRLLPDERDEPSETSRILLASGKVYYDLTEFRKEHEKNDAAILRVEQLYPLKAETLADALDEYPAGTPVYWVQEEPVNMGAWGYWKLRFNNQRLEQYPLGVVARAESASPATGSKAAHKLEKQDLLERAFG